MRNMSIQSKKIIWNVLLVVISTSLTLVVLEIAFRIAGVKGDYHQPRMDVVYTIGGAPIFSSPYNYASKSAIISYYDSDPRGYFEADHTISHKHNSIGWRDIEHAIKKTPGTFRILGLGDSFLWGQGVKQNDICLSQLPGLLKDSLPDKTIETINAGISGMNTEHELNQLKVNGLQYEPDLVIVHFVLNDVETDQHPREHNIEFVREYEDTYNEYDKLSSISYAWSWIRQRTINTYRAHRYIKDSLADFNDKSPGWFACRTALRDIKSLCDRNNVNLLVVIFPYYIDLDNDDYPFQKIHDTVFKYCRENGIHVLDLREKYRPFKGPDLWVHPSDQHPNEIAHKIAAIAIAQYLKENKNELLVRKGNLNRN
jgi:lysophospholipase L1-like esterase